MVTQNNQDKKHALYFPAHHAACTAQNGVEGSWGGGGGGGSGWGARCHDNTYFLQTLLEQRYTPAAWQ